MPYFTIDLFIDMMILLLHHNSVSIKTIVEQIIEIYEAESKESTYMDNDFFDFYIELIREIAYLNITINHKAEMETLLLKAKSSPLTTRDPEMFSVLKKVLTVEEHISEERKEYLLKRLKNCILFYQNTKYVKKMFGQLANTTFTAAPDKQAMVISEISNLCNELVGMNNKPSENHDDENRTKFLDFTDKDTIGRNIKHYSNTSVTNVIKTGLQGMNRSLGIAGGFKLGQAVVFNALSHQGKSLSLLKVARWTVALNKVSEIFKNPTCIVYSLENETSQNLMMLYHEVYCNVYKTPPPRDMSEEQIVALCYEYFNSMGWKLVVDRRLGAEFGFAELVANFEEYIRLGFTPLVCIIDYMNMLKKGNNSRGDETKGNYLLLRDLYTNVINYMKSKNCTLVTAHQLNRKAADVVSQNKVNAVKKFDISMLADGMDPQREVDVAYYQHKETDISGRVFMTWKLDKHRYDNTTKEEDKYFAYQFDGEIGILDDIHGEDKSLTNIHAAAHASMNAAASNPGEGLNLFGE